VTLLVDEDDLSFGPPIGEWGGAAMAAATAVTQSGEMERGEADGRVLRGTSHTILLGHCSGSISG
jgi:hypothetical protein